ncbi:MAG: hypothetical protein QM770_13115 [Tepidisphaeraceae bacterium]
MSALTLTGLLAGVGCSSMKNGSMAAVAPVTTEQPRVGSVYLLRGFIGVFSTGIDSLGDRINQQGVHAQVFQEAQWSQLADAIIEKYKDQPQHEPIVLIGHSYGADSVVRISRKVRDAGIKLDLVVTLDPVTPPAVPDNVKLVYNLYQSNGAFDALPWLRGIPLKAEDDSTRVALRNMNIRKDRTDLLEPGLDHFNIEKKQKVQDDVIAQVMNVCEPRPLWAMAHGTGGVKLAGAQLTPTKSASPTASPVKATALPANATVSAAPAASSAKPVSASLTITPSSVSPTGTSPTPTGLKTSSTVAPLAPASVFATSLVATDSGSSTDR